MSDEMKFKKADRMVGNLFKEYRTFPRDPGSADRCHLVPVAAAMDVAYQQLQKYEQGKNRLSMHRLLLGLSYLGVNPSMFMLRLATGTKPADEDYLPEASATLFQDLTRTVDIRRVTGDLLRQYRTMSQTPKLKAYAEAMGVVYQQAQKYEDGVNRISVSRLFLCLDYLNVNSAIFVMRLVTGTDPELHDFLPLPKEPEDGTPPPKQDPLNRALTHFVGAFIAPAALHVRNAG